MRGITLRVGGRSGLGSSAASHSETHQTGNKNNPNTMHIFILFPGTNQFNQ
jgi:hypothetical protein